MLTTLICLLAWYIINYEIRVIVYSLSLLKARACTMLAKRNQKKKFLR